MIRYRRGRAINSRRSRALSSIHFTIWEAGRQDRNYETCSRIYRGMLVTNCILPPSPPLFCHPFVPFISPFFFLFFLLLSLINTSILSSMDINPPNISQHPKAIFISIHPSPVLFYILFLIFFLSFLMSIFFYYLKISTIIVSHYQKSTRGNSSWK